MQRKLLIDLVSQLIVLRTELYVVRCIYDVLTVTLYKKVSNLIVLRMSC